MGARGLSMAEVYQYKLQNNMVAHIAPIQLGTFADNLFPTFGDNAKNHADPLYTRTSLLARISKPVPSAMGLSWLPLFSSACWFALQD